MFGCGESSSRNLIVKKRKVTTAIEDKYYRSWQMRKTIQNKQQNIVVFYYVR